MPFDIWSDLALTALCGTALVTWIGRDLTARARQWSRLRVPNRRSTSAARAAGPPRRTRRVAIWPPVRSPVLQEEGRK
jgi:hypothetical protein